MQQSDEANRCRKNVGYAIAGKALAIAAILLVHNQSSAFDGLGIGAGRAPGADSIHASLTTEWPRESRLSTWLRWTGGRPGLEATAAIWRTRSTSEGDRGTLYGLILLPTLRWDIGALYGYRAFAEAGIGPRIWSGTSLGSEHRFGTAFEFGSMLGIGIEGNAYGIHVRIEHTSNGSIRQPNPGINFVQLVLTRKWGK